MSLSIEPQSELSAFIAYSVVDGAPYPIDHVVYSDGGPTEESGAAPCGYAELDQPLTLPELKVASKVPPTGRTDCACRLGATWERSEAVSLSMRGPRYWPVTYYRDIIGL